MTEPKTRPYEPDDSDTAPVEETHMPFEGYCSCPGVGTPEREVYAPDCGMSAHREAARAQRAAGGEGAALLAPTTEGDWRDAATVCRERGWGPGVRLAGDEGRGVTVIEITALGETTMLAKTLTHDGSAPPWAGRESSWTLGCRDWRVVGR